MSEPYGIELEVGREAAGELRAKRREADEREAAEREPLADSEARPALATARSLGAEELFLRDVLALLIAGRERVAQGWVQRTFETEEGEDGG